MLLGWCCITLAVTQGKLPLNPAAAHPPTYLCEVPVNGCLVQWGHVNAIEGRLLPKQCLALQLVVQQNVAEGSDMDPS